MTRPFFGLCVFSWLAYMRPQDLCWGPARGLRFSLFVAVCMLAGFFFFETRKFTRRWPSQKWMLLLGLWITLAVFLHLEQPERQITKWLDIVKVFAVSLFTVGLVDSKRRLDIMLWTIGLSLGFYGIKGGLFGLIGGGRILQGPGGMLKDNNDFCLAMNMVLPILYYMAHSTTSKKARRYWLIATGLTIVAILITRSRGGFLTLVAVLGMFTLRSRHKFVGFSMAGFAVLLFIVFMPADIRARLATLKDPKSEGSAAGRFYAWAVAWEMAKAKPVNGVGFLLFTQYFRRYDPHPQSQHQDGKKEGSVRVAHNSYLQLLAETGFPALFFFLMMIFSTLLLMLKLKKTARTRDGPRWMINYANMIESSLLGFLVGATFLNRSHFDLLYHLVAMGGALYLVAMQTLNDRDKQPDEEEETPNQAEEPVFPKDPYKDPFQDDPYLVTPR